MENPSYNPAVSYCTVHKLSYEHKLIGDLWAWRSFLIWPENGKIAILTGTLIRQPCFVSSGIYS
jgi:hypothetical protein